MVQSRDGRARRVWFHIFVPLLSASTLAFAADQIEPFGVDTVTEATPSLAEQIDASVSPPTPSPPGIGNFRSRSQLTGDWSGARSKLAENGLTFWGDITQYYQGVTVGGLEQQFEYGGRGDYLLDFDSLKMGLWEGGHLDLRAETRLGQDCNGIDGSVAPSNFAMALPLRDQNVTALTGVQYTHDVSERASVFFGKLNLLDGTPAAYVRGMRLNYFWNTAMQSNLSRAYMIPSTLGAGFTIRDEAEPVFNFFLLDTHYTPTTSGFSELFTNGMVAYGEFRRKTIWFDRPGHHAFGFLYSTANRTALDSNPYEVLEAILAGEPVQMKDTAWTATYRFDHVVYSDAEDPKRNWTLNSDLGLTEGNPNPIRWFANLSLVGGSPIGGRQDDTIGIGYYHLGVSDLQILKVHGFGAENGVELFYNAAVTPAFHVTSDLQILDPAQHRNGTALLFGIRARLSF